MQSDYPQPDNSACAKVAGPSKVDQIMERYEYLDSAVRGLEHLTAVLLGTPEEARPVGSTNDTPSLSHLISQMPDGLNGLGERLNTVRDMLQSGLVR